MGTWYWIGVAAGLGTAVGIAIGALVPEGRVGMGVAVAAVLAVAAGIGIGLLDRRLGRGGRGRGRRPARRGRVGADRGAVPCGEVERVSASPRSSRLAGLLVAALAFVPAVGYLEAAAAPLLALRLRRRGTGRYAGLRILARD